MNRLFLWNLLPVERTDPAILEELKGPHPRSTGHACFEGHCLCPEKRERWVGGPCRFIDLATWNLFRETGRYGRRWWCIQGSKGGHRHRLTETERTIWQTLTGTDDTPIPGDLPYAPFDNRVIQQISGLDQKTKWLAVASYGMKNQYQLDSEEKAEVELSQRAIAKWFQGQMEEVADEYGTLLKRVTEDFQPTRFNPAQEEALAAEYGI